MAKITIRTKMINMNDYFNLFPKGTAEVDGKSYRVLLPTPMIKEFDKIVTVSGVDFGLIEDRNVVIPVHKVGEVDGL